MTPRASHDSGMALMEALVASAVLGIGLLGATQLTLKTLHRASESRQHTVAQQLAQEAMDCLRASPTLCPEQESITWQGVTYQRQAHTTPRGSGRVNDLQVSVTWQSPGTRPGEAPGNAGKADAPDPIENRIDWHSSVSAVPLWVGVSLP